MGRFAVGSCSGLAVVVLLAATSVARAQEAPPPDARQARRLAADAFAEGSRRFEKGDYLGAIDAFGQAYRLRPHYSVQCNMALCHERLGDFVSAAVAYRRCLQEGADRQSSAEQVVNSLERAEQRVAWITVESSRPGAAVYVDGRRHGVAPQRVAVNPGEHVVEARVGGQELASTTVTTRGAEQLTVRLEPQPVVATSVTTAGKASSSVERTSSSWWARRRVLAPVWFWSSVGLTGALALTATVFGIRTLQLHADYEDHPTASLRDKGRAYRTASIALWGLAAAVGAASATLFIFTDFYGSRATLAGKAEPVAGRRVWAGGIGFAGVF